MKIKITVNDIPDNEHITLDPCPIDGPAYSGSITNLDGICDRAEAVEILASSILDYIPTANLSQAISKWCELLRHGGKIILGGTNANEVSSLWINKQINTEQFNALLFGSGPVRHAAIYSWQEIVDILNSNGIKITRIAMSNDNIGFVIEGVRE